MVHAAPRGVPLDVVLDVADDQRRLLLENSKLQRSRNADCSALGFLLLLLRAVGTGCFPVLSFINAIRLSFWSGMCLKFL
jgi:hypothetical protein